MMVAVRLVAVQPVLQHRAFAVGGGLCPVFIIDGEPQPRSVHHTWYLHHKKWLPTSSLSLVLDQSFHCIRVVLS